jgi:UDP-N-acetylglucosamine 2-epimerase
VLLAKTKKHAITTIENIIYITSQLLEDSSFYWSMSQAHNPYGDGKVAEKI